MAEYDVTTMDDKVKSALGGVVKTSDPKALTESLEKTLGNKVVVKVNETTKVATVKQLLID